jgi:hypothetical protein
VARNGSGVFVFPISTKVQVQAAMFAAGADFYRRVLSRRRIALRLDDGETWGEEWYVGLDVRVIVEGGHIIGKIVKRDGRMLEVDGVLEDSL